MFAGRYRVTRSNVLVWSHSNHIDVQASVYLQSVDVSLLSKLCIFISLSRVRCANSWWAAPSQGQPLSCQQRSIALQCTRERRSSIFHLTPWRTCKYITLYIFMSGRPHCYRNPILSSLLTVCIKNVIDSSEA